ncbi:Uu.00g033630.m01.CDS01 [Anthostomella pinea]|uniref:Uu.00g033630.m01.CDS01 n=1 Tax=Anthostomella pinea TaxID=933095 RepID=A0AAI8V8X0_9PEZI|nr:Uu.00g033630.m01.CDS01 [Anthostomella pinea]
MDSTRSQQARERRTLRRSRFGCRNCKLRKLKCDELKPQCKKCTSFGVSCNFMSSHIPDLQPVVPGPRRPTVVARGNAKPQLQPPVTSAVWTSDEAASYQLNAKCQDFVTRYLGRSLVAADNPQMTHINRRLLKLAFAYPFLMHASLAVALTYDRHLNTTSGSRRSLEMCYHWSQGTVLLNRRLREPIETKDKDPIWATAAALAILTFSSPDASTPEESWPLRTSDHSDLDWVRMAEGKMALWSTLNPLRPDSLFTVMAPAYALMNTPFPVVGIDGIPRPLAAVCDLDAASTADSSPYFCAAHAVSGILNLSDSAISTGHTQIFQRVIYGRFECLLRERDPVALLLLHLWYRKASRGIWWIELRARVECPSICSYLRMYHGGNGAVLAFLPGGGLAGRWG